VYAQGNLEDAPEKVRWGVARFAARRMVYLAKARREGASGETPKGVFERLGSQNVIREEKGTLIDKREIDGRDKEARAGWGWEERGFK